MWALDCSRRLLSSCAALHFGKLESLTPSLSSLCGVATAIASVPCLDQSQSFLEFCSELLTLAAAIRDAGYKILLARLLLALLNRCMNSQDTFQSCLRENLSRTVSELVQDESRFSSLGKPLQVKGVSVYESSVANYIPTSLCWFSGYKASS